MRPPLAWARRLLLLLWDLKRTAAAEVAVARGPILNAVKLALALVEASEEEHDDDSSSVFLGPAPAAVVVGRRGAEKNEDTGDGLKKKKRQSAIEAVERGRR